MQIYHLGIILLALRDAEERGRSDDAYLVTSSDKRYIIVHQIPKRLFPLEPRLHVKQRSLSIAEEVFCSSVVGYV
jgi:hypothetical protein